MQKYKFSNFVNGIQTCNFKFYQTHLGSGKIGNQIKKITCFLVKFINVTYFYKNITVFHIEYKGFDKFW